MKPSYQQIKLVVIAVDQAETQQTDQYVHALSVHLTRMLQTFHLQPIINKQTMGYN